MARKAQKPSLEDAFLAAWKLHWPNLPEPTRQHPIPNPETGRDWKLDFCWEREKLYVEIQGFGRHTRLPGQAKDYDRQNYLTSRGWRGIFLNAINLSKMEDAVTITAEVLCRARDVE